MALSTSVWFGGSEMSMKSHQQLLVVLVVTRLRKSRAYSLR
jgi:hypothetical protein